HRVAETESASSREARSSGSSVRASAARTGSLQTSLAGKTPRAMHISNAYEGERGASARRAKSHPTTTRTTATAAPRTTLRFPPSALARGEGKTAPLGVDHGHAVGDRDVHRRLLAAGLRALVPCLGGEPVDRHDERRRGADLNLPLTRQARAG